MSTGESPLSAIKTYLRANSSGGNQIGPDGRVYWYDEPRSDMTQPGLDDLPDKPEIPNRYAEDIVEKFRIASGGATTEGQEIVVAVPLQWLTNATALITSQAGRIAAWDATLAGARIQDDKTGGILRFPGHITAEGDYTPEVLGEDVKVETVNEGPGEGIENGDPMFQRAKAALEQIHTFRRVDVDHETDIITTSSDGGFDTARYRSGLTEVTITISGYTR